MFTLACTTRPWQSLPLPAALTAIAAAGFTEVGLMYQASAEGWQVPVHGASSERERWAVQQLLADAGLQVPLLLAETRLGLGLAAASLRYARLIEHAAALGVSTLLDLGCEPAQRPAYLALMQSVLPLAEAAGLVIAIKPHGGISQTANDLLSLRDILGSKAFCFSFDPGNWLYYGGAEVPLQAYLQQLAPAIDHFILKDCQFGPRGPDVAVQPGHGIVDFPALLTQWQALTDGGRLYLECLSPGSPAELHTQARAVQHWLRQCLSTYTITE